MVRLWCPYSFAAYGSGGIVLKLLHYAALPFFGRALSHLERAIFEPKQQIIGLLPIQWNEKRRSVFGNLNFFLLLYLIYNLVTLSKK